MIIQSTDTFFYREPVFFGHRWTLFIEDSNIFVARKGRVTWSTTRRDLPKVHIHSRLISPVEDKKIIIGEEYTRCSIFKIKLLKPIPIPTLHSGKTQYPPDDEEVLSWT